MKTLTWLQQYFKQHFPTYHASGAGLRNEWSFTLAGKNYATIKKFSFFRYVVRVNNKFYYPQSMNEAFDILKVNLCD